MTTRSLTSLCTRYLSLRDDLKDESARRIDNTAKLLKKHFGADTAISQVTRSGAAEFRRFLRLRHMAEATIRLHMRNAKGIFRSAIDENEIEYNPFDRQKCSVPHIDARWATVTAEQMDAILQACPDDAWRRLIALCRWAGLRHGEALRLLWDEIDAGKRTLMVRVPGRGIEGTKQRARVVPIDPLLWRLLEGGVEGAEEGSRVCPIICSNYYRAMREILTEAKVPIYAKPFHTLRKNRETEWLERFPVMDVCAWMGHSPQVAMRHYHKPSDEVMARACR